MPGRFSGSRIVLLAAPSRPACAEQWLFAAFVPAYSGGTTTDLHRLPSKPSRAPGRLTCMVRVIPPRPGGCQGAPTPQNPLPRTPGSSRGTLLTAKCLAPGPYLARQPLDAAPHPQHQFPRVARYLARQAVQPPAHRPRLVPAPLSRLTHRLEKASLAVPFSRQMRAGPEPGVPRKGMPGRRFLLLGCKFQSERNSRLAETWLLGRR